MTIEESKIILIYQYKYGQMEEDVHKALGMAIALMDVYNVRLQIDMVAMFTELQLEIEELNSRAGYDGNGMPTFSTDYIRKKKVNELIQQKINSLKTESEAKDGKEKIQD